MFIDNVARIDFLSSVGAKCRVDDVAPNGAVKACLDSRSINIAALRA